MMPKYCATQCKRLASKIKEANTLHENPQSISRSKEDADAIKDEVPTEDNQVEQ